MFWISDLHRGEDAGILLFCGKKPAESLGPGTLHSRAKNMEGESHPDCKVFMSGSEVNFIAAAPAENCVHVTDLSRFFSDAALYLQRESFTSLQVGREACGR